MRPNNAFRDRLDSVLQSTRTTRQELQATQVTEPVQYNQQRGMPAFGNPMVLNTGIVAAAFQYNKSPSSVPVAPFALQPIVNSTIPFLAANFNRNKYCWWCGFQKKLHHDYGVPFGHNCTNHCNREDCSKCGQWQEFHHGGLASMGPYCMKAPHNQSSYHDWYNKDATTI
jgi:hypothetical protein